MKEFEPDSDTWNRKWLSSSLESGMEEFEPSSIPSNELGFNSYIPDSKTQTSIPDSKNRNLTRTRSFAIPNIEL